MKNSNKKLKKLLSGLLAVLLVFSFVGCEKKEPEKEYDRGFLFDFGNQYSSAYSSSWKYGSNVGKLNESVNNNARAKRTNIIGNNKDTVTILVYMCGADLESQGQMATYDLQEMVNASFGDNVNLIIYTGGCKSWHIKGISNTNNMILQVRNKKLSVLVDNAGNGSMIDPDNLESFITWGAKNFPANRMNLIFWDHGGGSVSGYGYDERYPNKGSMSLEQIDQALTEADVKFDFIGFDACLMANIETALMLTEHADYLIASEEAEPGIGWYYTDWLTAYGKNTSMPTLQVGKNIADSFVSTCASKTPKQPATLSVIDLAEVDVNLYDKLSSFAKSTTNLIKNNQYKTVVAARRDSREFAESSGVDLIDLVDLANGIGSEEGKALVDEILKCVKYNNTTNTITDAYGMSIYFPYRSTKYVNTVLNTYNNIDMSEDYANCIRNFVSYQTTGQVASGGSHTAQQSFQSYNTQQSTSQDSSDYIFDLLNMFINTSTPSQPEPEEYDPYASLIGFGLNALLGGLFGRDMSDYVAANHFDVDLNWKNGKIEVSEKQWSMVEDIKLNLFIDDGAGYIDLGNDYIYEVDDKGNLCQISDMYWLAASNDNQKWQVIPYYYTSSTIDGDNIKTTGRIPCFLNGVLADLIVYMDNDIIEVVGAQYKYDDVDVVSKNLTELQAGDEIEFICDYYDYNGKFIDNYVLNDKLVLTDGNLYLGDVDVSSYKYLATYQITDIFQQNYWTTPMSK